MVQVTFKLAGAKELSKLLDQLDEEVAGKLVRAAGRAGAEVIADEARRLVPVRDGELQASIAVSQDRNIGREVETIIGFRQPTASRAHLTEFGTVHSQARPFLRPAMDSKAQASIEAAAKSLSKGIAREARRLARKTRR